MMQQHQLPPNGLPRYERILYATDGSPLSREAGRHAVFLAQQAHAELIVLYVVPNSITRRISFLLSKVLSEERRLARQAVDELLELARVSGVPALSAVESGSGGEAIGRAAARFDADLIVVSSTGAEDLHRILGRASPGSDPLWVGRPVCVIMC
jgi:nucleotide-binding universal stress UspA family protein